MPDPLDQMYCAEQISVPTMFPYILKQYAKAAIRTQPYDLLKWSAAYFAAMASGEEPPVKLRIEYPPLESPSGLTPGYLRVLLKQLGSGLTVPVQTLYAKWAGVCLNENCLTVMIQIGGFQDDVDWLHFIGIAAAHLTDSLAQTMCLVCELLTEEPEGGSAMIPYETFCDVYTFLAALDCGPIEEGEGEDEMPVPSLVASDGADAFMHSLLGGNEPLTASQGNQTDRWHVPGIGPPLPPSQVEAVLAYMGEWAGRQQGMSMPRNVRHYLCPPLDSLPLSLPHTTPERGHDRYYYPKSNVYPQTEPLTCKEKD